MRLEYATVAWNVVSVGILVPIALLNSSAALIGFSIDSAIEVFASVVVIWELRATPKSRERQALNLLSIAFIASAGYIGFESVRRLVSDVRPSPSAVGTAWLALTVIAMLALSKAKDRTGKEIGNAVLCSEGRVTLIDAYVAMAVLGGLMLNAALGWWWADPTAALLIVGYALREGFEARRGAKRGIT
ncbi:MAG: hypothetical protein QOG54_1607 [Actinomycetota bacterium]|nr:hypothetical protein [Actinomycetota bacterium]